MNNPYEPYGISQDIYQMARQAEATAASALARIEKIREYNQLRVLHAFNKAGVSDAHFTQSTGYGYDDMGREKIEKMYADLFGAEAAYVRIQISSGTQAIVQSLFGVLRPGDEMLSVTGRPYDTLAEAIGIADSEDTGMGSLKDFGIAYKQVDLKADGAPDISSIRAAITHQTRLVFIQKSKGYTTRRCLLAEDLTAIIQTVKAVSSEIIIFVDNCYGEFVEEQEPCALGADLCAGSLIKNPGGGLCPSGGYVVGRGDLVEKVASRFTAPGLGSHVGPSLGFTRTIAQGLFLAPHITAECLKGAVFAASLFAAAGFVTQPSAAAIRGDIVQSIQLESGEQVVDFCQVIQRCAPVDSFVRPEPWAMPGYDAPVVMAAGTFIQGASVELSADGPIKPPYLVYMQGGLVYEQVKLAAMSAVALMRQKESNSFSL